ncbi:PREDICTED: butyrophilin-like protein 3 [Colobus angolensis palliatus]|uniref:butyrophilin-like protein 3 n=1 Tax=Colobus angolensis palliatus TaxID=336983 RepID=UPI0005F576D5|nr:PREDICTED: butyrophilin-like protein 3 [Colobus angolensis palliatus]
MAFVLILVLSFYKLVSGQWQVTGPGKFVQASVGEDAVFSCSLFPETSAEAMEVRFFRNQLHAVVHLYRHGEDWESMQMPQYRGRTELVKDSIAGGHVSLRLKNITPLDMGLYGCWFSSQMYDEEATWELQVSALGSLPLISVVGYVDGGIQLLCLSSGWFPQPTVKWKGPQGQHLSSDSRANADGHSLYDVETSIIVQENAGSILCSIHLAEQSHEVESKVLIGETFFQPSPWRLVSVLLGLLCGGLCVAVMGMTIVFFKSKGKIQAELDLEKIHKQAEFRDARKYAVEVTLDPETAHPQLCVSDLKTVTHRKAPQKVPYSTKRFTRKSVVASQGFQAGKHYWEVDVGQNVGWCVGVCQDDVDRRKDSVTLSPNHGYWVFGLMTEYLYFTFNPYFINLSPRTPPTRVGVLLDYEGGKISFFNTNDQSCICTLTCQFEGFLRPYIWHEISEKKMGTPIFLCPVSWDQREKTLLKGPDTADPDTAKGECSPQATPASSPKPAHRKSRLPLSFRVLRFFSPKPGSSSSFQIREDWPVPVGVRSHGCPEVGME